MDNFWKGKKVLVTGATGFIGANVTRALADRDAVVMGLDIITSSKVWHALNLGKVSLFTRDLTLTGVDGYVKDVDVVYHLAGAVDVHYCHTNPERAYADNVTTTMRVLEAVRKAGRAAVFASSDRVYGSWITTLTENHELRPNDIYGATKAAADVLCVQAANAGYQVATMRHVNSYGELDPHKHHLIPSAVAAVVRGEQPVIKSDGSPRKSYLHIDDVVSAYLALGAAVYTGEARGAYNCTGLDSFSVLEVVGLICQIGGYKAGPQVLGTDLSQSGYVERLDGTKLRRLGWSQQVSLSDGIERMFAASTSF